GDRVNRGGLYMGCSAGDNLSGPSLGRRHGMPIVDPNGFGALDLFPLQINPHFTNAVPEGHKGETREQRIRELLVVAPELTENGLAEGNGMQVSNGAAVLRVPTSTRGVKVGGEAGEREAGAVVR
ncbi:Type 1 glutamine amidotransferase-like domain-containing protein, partial [Salmonella enterica]|uniref:Type 1 glutamine amidotransferase-like domain-containing protein n=1 Tax=Salmonella enterica TaxID=28901 RepID=UPI00398C7F61